MGKIIKFQKYDWSKGVMTMLGAIGHQYDSNSVSFNHVAVNIDKTLRPSPLPGLSYFDGQVFYKKRVSGH